MKSFKVISVLALALLLLMGSGLDNKAYAGRQDFTLVNYSGRTIYKLYISRSDHTDWEEDVLGNGTLPHGQSRKVNFSSSERGVYWDILAVFQNGDEWRWDGIDLTKTSQITIDGTGTIHY